MNQRKPHVCHGQNMFKMGGVEPGQVTSNQASIKVAVPRYVPALLIVISTDGLHHSGIPVVS